MPGDLRKELAKQSIEGQHPRSAGKRDWSERTRYTIAAHAAGWSPPDPQFPIIIHDESAIRSTEDVQRLLDLPSAPNEANACIVRENLDPPADSPDVGTVLMKRGDSIRVCELSYEQTKTLETKGQMNWHYCVIDFHGMERYAIWVSNLNRDEEHNDSLEKHAS
ncbi:hypothetical protein HJFPF1_05319 [Paramyrothecium foliicola]|nr:hypothetical protein HJFPF1_05319 [Paramyrothecium foliicola]